MSVEGVCRGILFFKCNIFNDTLVRVYIISPPRYSAILPGGPLQFCEVFVGGDTFSFGACSDLSNVRYDTGSIPACSFLFCLNDRFFSTRGAAV